MTQRFLIATRKGLFGIERRRSGWSIAEASFLGEPVSMTTATQNGLHVYAALKTGHFGPKLFCSEDGGGQWKEIQVPAFPQNEALHLSNPPKGPSLTEIWALQIDPRQEGRLWAGGIPAGLFRSEDGGNSWEWIDSLWNLPERASWLGGGSDEPGLHSICLDPNDGKRLFVAISCGGVYESMDDGHHWISRGQGFYADYMPPERRFDPAIQDVHRLIQAPSHPQILWAQHHNGIFRSTDYARSWHPLSSARPSGFGFALAVHPADPDVAWFVPAGKDDMRIPVNGEMIVSRTRDGGQSFETLRQGLPQTHAYDLVYRHALAVDAGGNGLVMGSTTGHCWISDNGGDSWTLAFAHLPPIYAVHIVT